MEVSLEIQYQQQLEKVKKYITINPGRPKYLVSAKTGVSLEIIRQFIENGILVEENGVLKEEKRNFSQERRALIYRLRDAIKEDYEEEQMNKGKSKLIIDLEEKNSDKNQNEKER